MAGGANVILTGGVDLSFIQGGLRAAEAKAVMVASLSQYVPPDPDGYKFDIGADYQKLGNMLGDWLVADSGGKGVLLPFRDKWATWRSTRSTACWPSSRCGSYTADDAIGWKAKMRPLFGLD